MWEQGSGTCDDGVRVSELDGLVGTQIRQRYRILGQLGSGGLGVVLKAEDRVLERVVALKTLRASVTGNAEDRGALLAEARSAARLVHPGIATIYELAEDDGGACIAMELVEGSTVRELCARGPLDPGEAARIALACAQALAAAHDAGIIHCDIKPSNIMVNETGAVKVLDFGLARLARNHQRQENPEHGNQQHDQHPSNTSGSAQPPGAVSGTLGYMSPEQLRGRSIDGRTDVFSLGVVLYEMLAGIHPFAGPDALAATLEREPVPLGALRAGLPPELEHIVRRTLAKDPTQRYQSAHELAVELERIVGRETVHARLGTEQETVPEQPVERLLGQPSWALFCQRYRGALAAGIVLGIAGAGVFVLSSPIRWLGVGASMLAAAACANLLVRARHASAALPTLCHGGTAFRGLLPFSESDRERFYGRDAEIAALVALITSPSFRFGVLYGESGCGKTSLLRAGVFPRLWEAGLVPLYCRLHRDPLAVLRDEAQRQTGLAPKPSEPTLDYLRRLGAEHSARVVVIFDQFEELFISFPEASAREPFLAFVAECQRDASAPVAFLCSVRSDFLYLIGTAFDGRVRDPLSETSRLQLKTFTPEQARIVVERSVLAGSLALEPGLPEQLVRDLARDGRVLPSELQIVGDQIQQRRVLTIREYRAIGGKEALVHGYLADVLRCARDQEGARLVLRSLISDENTRLTLCADEIARRTQRGTASVDECLRLFVQARLVRALQDEQPWRYELIHEYLIDQINRVAGKVMDARQRANRLLRQHLSHFSVEPQTRIPLAQLLFIRRYSERHDDAQARALMRKSLARGAFRVATVTALFGLAAALAVALLSIREEWHERVLNGGHTAAARKLAFSPDGKELISVGEDGRALAWDFPRRELRRVVEEGNVWVQQVAYLPNGRYFATGTRDGAVTVRLASNREPVAHLGAKNSEIGALAFSPDSKVLLASALPGGTWAWEVGSWRQMWRAERGTNYGNFGFLRSAGLAVNNFLDTFEVDSGRIVRAGVDGLGGNAIASSPTDDVLTVVDSSGRVAFYDATTLTPKTRTPTFTDFGRAVAFSPDGALVATAAEDIVLWDAKTFRKLQRLMCSSLVWDLRFSPDGKWLVSSHGDGSVLVWNVEERELDGSLNGHSAPARAVAYSPDGTVLASAGEDRTVIVWDVATGRKRRVLRGHTTRVVGVAFSPGGRYLFSVENSGRVFRWLWGVPGGGEEEAPRFSPHTGTSYDITVSPDSRLVAISDTVFDSHGNVLLEVRPLQGGQAYGVAFSRDGHLLAMGTELNVMLLVQATPQTKLLAKVESSAGLGIIDVAFSPRDDTLLVGSDNGELWLWQVEPLRPKALLGRHAARIKSVAFSPDGRRAVSAGNGGEIVLWNIDSRRQLARIGPFRNTVNGVAFSPDGEQIAAAGSDGTVRTYALRHTLWGHTLPNTDWL
jgi:WD40 repeat protein